MSRAESGLFTWLLDHRTKEELARQLVDMTKEIAALRDKVGALETEIFWMKVAERNNDEPASPTWSRPSDKDGHPERRNEHER